MSWKYYLALSLAACWVLCACAGTAFEYQQLAPMPRAVSNNPVALVGGENRFWVHSFMGLEPGKTWRDISSAAVAWDSATGEWSDLPTVPVPQGRLASVAVTVRGAPYLIGGYTVAADGTEVSTPEVFRLTHDRQWQRLSNMPVPVDDTVALVYRDRYIYLVSGWHDVGNVNLVQVYDSVEHRWQQAEPWPGVPVFGHTGGISGNVMVICDGVGVHYPGGSEPRQFRASAECWRGEVSDSDVRRIRWQRLASHPGAPRYRMAATGAAGRIIFLGGSANPYNYNGIGYDGHAAEPEAMLFSYDLASGQWQCHGHAPVPSMDHRSLLEHGGWFYVVGGMLAGQQTTAQFARFRLPEPSDSCQE